MLRSVYAHSIHVEQCQRYCTGNASAAYHKIIVESQEAVFR